MIAVKTSFLAEINIQTISEPNDTNFVVGLAGGHEVFGKPEQYDAFIDKYLIWLEMR